MRFTDGEISRVSVLLGGLLFSPNDILGLGRPVNVILGIKVASRASMIRALRFLEKVF